MKPEEISSPPSSTGSIEDKSSPAEAENVPDQGAGTIATYEQIADIYYGKWHDRSAIAEHLARFVDMMRGYGLTGLPVVDVGCGPGFDADFFRRAGLHAIGLDLSPAMMAAGRPAFGGDYVLADMRHLPLAATLGGLWVSASMLHLPREEIPTVLERFAGALAPGGLLYLSLKAGQGAEWTAESHGLPLPRYFVYWQPEELDTLLHKAGFQVVDSWTSPANESTTWLIRFARKADGGRALPLTLA